MAAFVVYGLISFAISQSETLVTGILAGAQFDSSAASYLSVVAGIGFFQNLATVPGIIFLVVLALIWFVPARRLVASMMAMSLLLAFAPGHAHAFFDTTDRTEVYYILPNQSAFWIPDVGNNLQTQVQFGSAAYYDANKIPAKRFIVPHTKLSGSGGTSILSGYDYYVPTGRLYVVDRSPYFREWVDEEHRGTSTAQQGFHFETLDSVNMGTGITISASVPETSASVFLYTFGTKTVGDASKPENQFASVIWGMSLTDVMDTIVRGKVQELIAGEFSKRTFIDAIAQKSAIMAAVAKGAREEFGPKGIVIDFIGYSGPLDFSAGIQASIDRTVIASNDAVAAGRIKPLSKFFTSILPSLLIAVAMTLVAYGVNKSREIGGWAVWIVLVGCGLLWGALNLFGL